LAVATAWAITVEFFNHKWRKNCVFISFINEFLCRTVKYATCLKILRLSNWSGINAFKKLTAPEFFNY